MTDKTNASEFSIEKLKEVTDKHNRVLVRIPSSVYTYRSYYGMPANLNWDDDNEEFTKIVKELAFLMANDVLHLMKGVHERYWAHLMQVEYHKVFNKPKDTFKKCFKILNITKISAKMYEKDIIHVYNDSRMLVIVDEDLAEKVRKVRGLE